MKLKTKEESTKLKKTEYLKNLRNKIHEQMNMGALNGPEFAKKMQEVKDLEDDKEIDWDTFVPET